LKRLERLSNDSLDLIHAGRLDEAEPMCQQLMNEFPAEFDGHMRPCGLLRAGGAARRAAEHLRIAAAMARTSDYDLELAAGLDAEANETDPPAGWSIRDFEGGIPIPLNERDAEATSVPRTACACSLVELVITGGTTRSDAAAQLEVPESTPYYWLKRAGRRLLALVSRGSRPRRPAHVQPIEVPTFARLVRATEVADTITLRVDGVAIEVRAGFDVALLREVVAALMEGRP